MPEGSFVHRFVRAPAASPLTLLLLHGTGGNENNLLELGREISPEAALLSPRGNVLENGMPRFFRRLAEGVFDIDDLVKRTHELSAFVEASSRHYHFDPGRVVAIGYSNGANIAASVLLLHPGLLSGAILFRPMIPLIPERPSELSGRRIFILAGLRDTIVPREQTEQLAEVLREAHADITLHWQDCAHAITSEEVALARNWFSAEFSGQT